MIDFTELAKNDRTEADIFEFFACIAEGSYPVDPPVVPDAQRAAEIRSRKAQCLADADGWDEIAAKQ